MSEIVHSADVVGVSLSSDDVPGRTAEDVVEQLSMVRSFEAAAGVDDDPARRRDDQSSVEAFVPVIVTCAPASTNFWATASPRPLDPPVTRTLEEEKSNATTLFAGVDTARTFVFDVIASDSSPIVNNVQ
jgi:hypothetical protein